MPKFSSVRFGELEYRDEDVIRLPEGLIGMPHLHQWLILEMGDNVPMKWFQSLDRGDFGFPVTPLAFFIDEFDIEVPQRVKLRLETRDDDDLVPLIITTVHPGGGRVTGNTMAPLVLDTESRYGAQLNLDDEKLSFQQEIDYFKFGLAVNSDSSDNDAPPGTGVAADAEAEVETVDIGA
jgi:flagellar assembly factor FliW